MPTFNHEIKHYLHAILLGVLLSTSVLSHAATKEEAVKAGSIYNFTKFAVWPTDVSASDHFNLCVFSQNKPNGGLQALGGKLVADKPLVVRHNVKTSSIHTCHMAYIADDSEANIQKTLNKVKKYPILTVSDHPDFIRKGGMIGFVRSGSHVGFEINIAVANAAGVEIGSQLLKLAKTVKGLK